MLVALLALTLAAAEDLCPARAGDVAARAAGAEAAYLDGDLARFDAEMTAMREGLGCLDERLSPEQAARVHLVVALDHWTLGEQAPTQAALRGLLSAAPGFVLTGPLDEPELGAQLERARRAREARGAPLGPGIWFLDGRAWSGWVPEDRAAVLQRVEPEGLRTWYLLEVPPPDLPAPPPQRSRGLLIAGASAGATSALCLGVAAAARSAYLTEPSERTDRLNRVTGISGYALAAASGGLLVGAWITAEHPR